MAKTNSTRAQAFLALSCVSAALAPGFASAQEVPAASEQRLGGMTVTDTAIEEDEVKVDRVESPKYVRPLLDTPQTITVISNRSIREQNLLTLRDVLQTVPGITFAAGEGGFGSGDNINIRGYNAQNDITTDGVRSSAFYNRNEVFNTEQVEVTNGANSVVNGGGSVGGTINLVSKRPKADDAIILGGQVGTDNYWRGTIDANKRLSETVAFRLNAVVHRDHVPGRDVERNKRWGIAPAVTIGIDGPTQLTLMWEHVDDQAFPSYGIPYVATAGGVLPAFNRAGYYGLANVDQQDAKSDMGTIIVSHELGDKVSIRNLSRYQVVNQYTITSQPAGTFCLPSGLTTTGGACTASIRTSAAAATTLNIPAGYYLPTGGRGNGRRIKNETIYNQLDLSAEFDTGGITHTLVLGASALWEEYNLRTGNVLRTPEGFNPYAEPFVNTGTTAAPVWTPNPLFNAAASRGLYLPLVNIANPGQALVGGAAPAGTLARVYGDNSYTGPINFTPGSGTKGEQTSYAIYLFDAIKFTDWFELNAGVRYEKVKGYSQASTFVTNPGATKGQETVAARIYNSDELFSYRVGAVFKPTENTSVYVAYGNSATPSKANVNGSCSTAATNGNCNVNPEKARNIEIGAKADLVGGRLQLTAAIFRNERNGYRVNSQDPSQPDQVLEGKSRVDGIALGANGAITDAWTVSANYTYLKSKLIQGVATRCLVPGTPRPTGCTNSATDLDPGAGQPLNSTPAHSGSLFTSYTFPFGLQLGYGFNYQGTFSLNPAAATAGGIVYKVPSYLIHRAMVSYKITDQLSAQVNVQNFTNKKYLTTVRTATGGNAWANPGATRQAIFSVNYNF